MEGSGAAKAAVIAVGGSGLMIFAVIAMLIMVIVGADDDKAAEAESVSASMGLNGSHVPEPYRQFVAEAGEKCPEVPAPVIAAQIEAESNWNPKAESPVGALGLTQFMPGTWKEYGIDGNNDGSADPYNPADAIASQANYMCALVPSVKGVADKTKTPILDLLLAAYNAGPGAVQTYNGIPPYAETQKYVKKIKALIDKYSAPMPTSGGWTEPLQGNFTRGTPFWKPGAMWAWKGHHTGVDFVAPVGTKVVAAGPGTISVKESGGSYGNHIEIDHGQVDGKHISTLYAHLSAFAEVRVGQKVQPGQLIGYVGQTGNTTGPHLHFEVHANWKGGVDNSEFLDGFAWLDSHRGPPATSKSGQGAATVAFARRQIGVPYSWGGGGMTKPGEGFGVGAGVIGWDCSSLARASVYAGSGGAVTMSRVTSTQVKEGKEVPASQRQPGDLIFWKTDGSGGWSHVGIYIGNNEMIHAPKPGDKVKIADITTNYYTSHPSTTRRML